MKAQKLEPRRAGAELIIPIGALIFTLYYFSTIIDSPWEAQAAAFLIGTILLGLIVALFVRTALEWRTGAISFAVDPTFLGEGGLLVRRLGLVALTVGFTIAIDWWGFTLTTFVFLAAGMLLLGANERPLRTVGLAALIALAGYLLFIVAFDTRFPRGVFERLMQGIIG